MCKHPYQNDYGDIICPMLIAGEVVDLGAICDLFEEESNEEPSGS